MESHEALEAIGKAMQDPQVFRKGLKSLVQGDKKIRIRLASLLALRSLNTRDNQWAQESKYYEELFKSKLPDELLKVCSQDLVRSMKSQEKSLYPLWKKLDLLKKGLDERRKEKLLNAEKYLEIFWNSISYENITDPVNLAYSRIGTLDIKGFINKQLNVVKLFGNKPAPLSVNNNQLKRIWIKPPYPQWRAFQKQVNDLLGEGLTAKGKKLEKGKQWEQARKNYTKMLDLSKKKDNLDRVMGLVLDTFLQESPNGNFNKKINAFKKWSGQHLPVDKIADRIDFFLCRTYYREKKFENALSLTSAFKEKHPNSRKLGRKIDLLKGLIFVRMENKEKALDQFGIVVKDNPKDETAARALFLTGWLYLLDMENEKAIPPLKRVIELRPNSEYAKKAKDLLKKIDGNKAKKEKEDVW